MPQISHQTIKLSKGKHHSPTEGACVMELASMLAGEPFTDHPYSVSRPIGSFLRRYNDLLDDDRRQDLYLYAARIVGTAAEPETEEARTERLMSWADEQWARRRWPVNCRLAAARRRKKRAKYPESAGSYAIRAIPRLGDRTHAAALELLDELIAISAPSAERRGPLKSPAGTSADARDSVVLF
jgi:hypothetical protein